MGYRCRWLATRNRDRAEVLAALGFVVETELNEEIYDPGLYAAMIGDWYVVFGDGWDYMDLVTRQAAAKLSSRGEVLYVYTDGTPMKSEVTAFVDGQIRWSFVYDDTASTEGALPAEAKALIAAAERAQKAEADVDHVYDVPAQLGLALVGFRHDTTLGEGAHLPVYQLKAIS